MLRKFKFDGNSSLKQTSLYYTLVIKYMVHVFQPLADCRYVLAVVIRTTSKA
jgi:hypothetical protein